MTEIGRFATAVEEFVEANELPMKLGFELNVVLDEILTNIIKYGYDTLGVRSIHVEMTLAEGLLTLTVEDDAKAFNPLDRPDPNVDAPLEEREVGGLGIYFVKKLMDTVEYERRGEHNVLMLKKRV
jgi:anti-sigma regulatory factor (Ser/Thr protein kinase)